ncbi:MAG: hypothetical protein RIA69_08010 [Cyclobacteriaceae bacterium]
MTRFLTLLSWLFLCGRLSAQVSACGYYGDNAVFSAEELCKQYGYENTKEAEQSIQSIMTRLGLQMNFLIIECNNISNAYAVNLEGDVGQLRYIVYDKSFLNFIDTRTQSDWSAVSILAHEIGHHLNGHTLDGQGSRPPKELEADEFSGFALYMLGASLEQAQAAMSKLAGNKTSDTHPAKDDRLSAIAEGYQNAEKLVDKYQRMSRHADYATYAQQWFKKAYAIQGNTIQDHARRIAYYQKATEYLVDYAQAYRNLAKHTNILAATAASNKKEKDAKKLYDDALREANRAISADPDMWNAYTERAVALYGLKRFEESLEAYNIVINHRSEPMATDYAGRGTVYTAIAKNEEAKKDFEKALELKPGWKRIEEQLEKIGL